MNLINQRASKTSTFDCKECEDLGLILKTKDDGTEIGILCHCNKKRKVDRLKESSQITTKFLQLGFGNFFTENRPKIIEIAKNTALEYLSDFENIRETRVNSISLLGSPGTGKTHLLTAICNNLMRKGIEIYYFPFVEGFNEIKRDLNNMDIKIERMKKVDVLFIDDLFKGRDTATQFQIEQVYGVINYRYLNYMPILLSSEKTIDDLCNLDEALGSRIFEMSCNYLVQIKGDRMKINYRLRALQ